MSTNAKAGLFFGITMAICNALFSVVSEPPQRGADIIRIIITAVICGGLSGLLFGWWAGKFASSKFVRDSTKIETDVNEPVIFQGAANHFKGMEGVGGKLYLTATKLVFKSHKLNIQNHQLNITLTDIIEIDKYKVLGISDKGLRIKTSSSNTEKFVVEKPNEWIQLIRQKENGVQHQL